MISTITVLPGHYKNGQKEDYSELTLRLGELYAIVGNTGAGKSRLIKDLEQLVNRDSVTGRKILVNGKEPDLNERYEIGGSMIAHLGQSMRFILDKTVREFLFIHGKCRGKENTEIKKIVEIANHITPEPIDEGMNLNMLSGGQTRALMIADISMVCDSPIVLIDEIENAGINKKKALELLLKNGKLVMMVTHNVHTALMAQKRILLKNGGIEKVLTRTKEEYELYKKLDMEYDKDISRQDALRNGEEIK